MTENVTRVSNRNLKQQINMYYDFTNKTSDDTVFFDQISESILTDNR